MRLVLLPLLVLLLVGQAASQNLQPTKILVNNVELHYIEQGQGEPLILLHGGLGDYRSWDPQIKTFSPHYRVIAYSRRYNYPNHNPSPGKNHSAYVEADDLAALIHKLKLGRVHLAGTSIGAFAALVFAVRHPEMVRSLILAEPPLHQLVRNTPAGEAIYQEFMAKIHNAAAAAFQADDDKAGLRIFVDGLAGVPRFDTLPPENFAAIMQNALFFKALTLSTDPYPNLSKDKVKHLHIPVLIIRGEDTIRIHKMVNEELARILPKAEQAIIPKAGHGSPRKNPQVFNEAMDKFLNHQRR